MSNYSKLLILTFFLPVAFWPLFVNLTQHAYRRISGRQYVPRPEPNEVECPIRSHTQDKIGRQTVVERIVSAIKSRKSVALLGTFGIGKSSVVNLVESDLENSDVYTCRPRVWGKTDDGLAVAILEAVVDTVANDMDTLAFRSLPSNLIERMSSAAGAFSTLVQRATESDPEELLANIDEKLSRMGKTICIILEDMDRNHTFEAYKTTLSLIDLMRPLLSIRYIATIGLDQGSHTVSRLFDRIEVLPNLNVEQVGAHIDQKIRELSEQYTSDVRFEKTEEAFKSFFTIDRRRSIIWALSQILDTPRKLNLALRNVDEAWTSLHGEVSLTDLIVERSLRSSVPEIWSFIVSRQGMFESLASANKDHGEQDFQKEANKQSRAKLVDELGQICQSISVPLETILVITKELFGTWANLNSGGGYLIQAQRSSSSWGQRYWERLVSGTVTDCITDQELLAALEAFKNGHFALLLSLQECDVNLCVKLLYIFERKIDADGAKLFIKIFYQTFNFEEYTYENSDAYLYRSILSSLKLRSLSISFYREMLQIAIARKSINAFVMAATDLSHAAHFVSRSVQEELITVIRDEIRCWLCGPSEWVSACPRLYTNESYSVLPALMKWQDHFFVGPKLWTWCVADLRVSMDLAPETMPLFVSHLLARRHESGNRTLVEVDEEFIVELIVEPSEIKVFCETVIKHLEHRSGFPPLSEWQVEFMNALKAYVSRMLQ